MKMTTMSVMVVLILMVLSTVVIPSSAQGVDGPSTKCPESIATGCNSTQATAEELLVTCCKALKDAAGFEKQCFCNVMSSARTQSTTSDESYNALLTTCKIPGTVDSLCPGTTHSASSDSTLSQSPGSKIGIVIGIIVGVVLVI